jgi:hypothetical protein
MAAGRVGCVWQPASTHRARPSRIDIEQYADTMGIDASKLPRGGRRSGTAFCARTRKSTHFAQAGFGGGAHRSMPWPNKPRDFFREACARRAVRSNSRNLHRRDAAAMRAIRLRPRGDAGRRWGGSARRSCARARRAR